ncbi:helix-turn-helix domain-containing protein [Stratiformator vulcanicus]|uniref:Uncharacterized protein n=1 Tax=Stratiformator vulcanicus TaxID=2527980 RepID=A0A517R7B4_9PLAN|nr:LysR family transcriptional regulator [Stratiformator vulcanicus]QDT39713.1 hypothetical protein Pan189_41220 [Stratiformator vulcanicus]
MTDREVIQAAAAKLRRSGDLEDAAIVRRLDEIAASLYRRGRRPSGNYIEFERAVATYGSQRKAADALGVSQSVISRTLANRPS